MSHRLASLTIRLRVLVVVGWIAAAVVCTLTLPTIREAQVGALGDLVPVDAQAIDAELRSAELFAFPVLSRTVVVIRDPGGLSIRQQALIAERLVQLNRGELPRLRATRGYLVPNVLGVAPAVRERSTTILLPLLFPPDVGPTGRNAAAQRLAREHLRPLVPGGFVGVTGAIPARAEQARQIEDHLPLVELATILFVLAAVGLYFRAVLAPIVNLVAVALSYLISIRVLAVVGQALGVSVPSEVQPVIVALLFGVVTDYTLFYLSRYRRRLGEQQDAQAAARQTAAELTPIVVTCGMAVVAASAALLVADLGFLQAFGPGMAMAALVAVAVSVTFIPAAMGLLGNSLFWPTRPSRERAVDTPRRADRLAHVLVAFAVRRPRPTILVCLVGLTAMASGTLWMNLGNPLVRSLPPDSPARVAYVQAQRGFVPGALSPTVLIVEQDGIERRPAALSRLQQLLRAEPGVAEVIGPATNPTDQRFGAVLALPGNAARFIVVLRANPLGAGAIERLRRLRGRAGPLLRQAGLSGAAVSFAGDTALSQETVDDTVDNIGRVVPAVLLAVLLVLVLFLRSLVAPLYLVLAAVLAPLASLGLAVGLFQGVLGNRELTYYVPVAAGVLLVALGSDYNIFLAGRVWAEARRRSLEEAIVVAGAGAARAISAAGIVLAVSFALMALIPLQPFRELAFVMAAGLLIDAFIVRTVLVPAVISLVGYRSGWPGRWLRPRPSRLPPET